MTKLLKQPTAWIPLTMSLVAFLLVVVYVLLFGIARQEDEGAAAHIFQLLLVGQLPFMGYFALRWLPKKPKDAFIILIIQVIAGIIALAPIFILET